MILGMSLKGVRRFVHKKLKAFYPFKPIEGHEKYSYQCPFCGFMVSPERFLELKIPEAKSNILVFGGYRGLRHLKPDISTEMRLKILEAMQEKIKWLYEKLGGEIIWLKSRSASILVAPSTSYWRTVGQSRPLETNVNSRIGMIRITKSGSK
jgi:hypothetical protein